MQVKRNYFKDSYSGGTAMSYGLDDMCLIPSKGKIVCSVQPKFIWDPYRGSFSGSKAAGA
jgi:hypothetical protein